MLSRLFGGLCCATFCITAVAHLAAEGPGVETKVPAYGPVDHQVAELHQACVVKETKTVATRLVAVTSPTCPPCQRLKRETLPVLAKEGYTVNSVNFRDWNGPVVERVPTLFYFDRENKLIPTLTEVGFRTPDQIKQKLEKP